MNNGKFYAGAGPDHYDIGPCETRDQAVEEYREENGGEEPGSVGIETEVFATVDGYILIETVSEHMLDVLYEDATNGWCEFRPNDPRFIDLSQRLTKTLHEWLDEVGEKKSWTVIEEMCR